MLILALCVLAVLSPLLFGGQLSRLAMIRFRGWWIIVGALVAQILIIELVPDGNPAVLEAVHNATYVAAGLFVAVNWRIPGLLIIGAGTAMNGITIALNGGQLPASKPALQMAGIEVAKGEFVNSGVLPDPVLPLLGDIFVWPQPFPFANVFSFGDVLIVFGTFYLAHKVTGTRLVSRRWEPVEGVTAPAATEQLSGDVLVGHAPTQAPPALVAPVAAAEKVGKRAGATRPGRPRHAASSPGSA